MIQFWRTAAELQEIFFFIGPVCYSFPQAPQGYKTHMLFQKHRAEEQGHFLQLAFLTKHVLNNVLTLLASCQESHSLPITTLKGNFFSSLLDLLHNVK